MTYYTIKKNEEIASGIFTMAIESSDIAKKVKPGQFVNVYLCDSSRILPRPISVCDVDGSDIILVYKVAGEGTRELAAYPSGQNVRVMGPLGNGFQLNAGDPSVIVAGGVGVPPMLSLAKSLKQANGNTPITAILGFRDQPFLVERFEEVCDRVITMFEPETVVDGIEKYRELLSLPRIENTATGEITGKQDSITTGDRVLWYSCGPKPMLAALCRDEAIDNEHIQVSMEERMGCGYGACVGCTCATKSGLKKVCKDGPVFKGSEVEWNGI